MLSLVPYRCPFEVIMSKYDDDDDEEKYRSSENEDEVEEFSERKEVRRNDILLIFASLMHGAVLVDIASVANIRVPNIWEQ